MKLTLSITASTLLFIQTQAAGVDWRYTTPRVKNQQDCGSSYAFAVTSALEGALYRKYNKNFDLSEQNIVDCSYQRYNGGCQGGHPTSTYQFLIQQGGIMSGTEYPYENRVGYCRYNPSRRVPEAVVRTYVKIPSQSESALSQALAMNGPIVVAMDANPRSLQFYNGGVYNDRSCSSTQLNHYATLVGEGVENGYPYWLIKNSWGTGWGMGGYIKIAKGQNVCGIATDASYPMI